MKRFVFLVMALGAVSFSSCIKDEAPNAEADITSATIDNASTLLDKEATIENNRVNFRLKAYAEDYIFAPEFTLTPGAVIDPASGTSLDFAETQQYVVTSEDGQWQKTYEVSFTTDVETASMYSFEYADTVNTENPEGHYHRFYRYSSKGKKSYNWATGNPGYNILAETLVEEGEDLTPLFYPTAQIDDGFAGRGVRLRTKETGSLGGMVGSPLAAGNLFLGDFVLTFPAIKSPHFGQPYKFNRAPVALKGHFKYKAGKDFEVNTTPSELDEDTWDAYAILFEKRDEDNYLPGDHNFEDSRMVSVAKLADDQRIEADQWTEFYIPFDQVNGKTFDPDQEYMYTIVFSSSKEGDLFNGAPGSTLWIDEVELVLE